MIIKIILTLMGTIISVIVNAINGLLPSNTLVIELDNIIIGLLQITQQGVNFLYFIFGDILYSVVPVAITLVTTKFIIVPIIELCRGFFINSTE